MSVRTVSKYIIQHTHSVWHLSISYTLRYWLAILGESF